MNKVYGCCGIECSECKYYKNKCDGCFANKGKVFWAKFTENGMCESYHCCVERHGYANCGKCPEAPCKVITLYDPSMSVEQNQKAREAQLINLKDMSNEP